MTKLLELKSHPMFSAEKNSLKQDQMWLRDVLEREVRKESTWRKHLQWATDQDMGCALRKEEGLNENASRVGSAGVRTILRPKEKNEI